MLTVCARIAAAGLLALVLLAAPAIRGEGRSEGRAEPRERAPWEQAERWQRLRIGMTPFEVFRILGPPGKTTRYYGFTRWEYPDALGRRVNFDERGRLVAWGRQAR